ncbi:MAG: holo-ACP synthase [Sandaracinaceae bacterium]|nr:holo-ACP synthase [Sandaracinaceae bacterium]
MIVGLGLDVCDIDRMRRNLERHGAAFMDKVLTPEERAYCERRRDPAVPFAGRFAAKEAAIKALGAPDGLRFSDMVILPADNAPPKLLLRRVGAQAARALGATRSLLTITHDGGVAAAVVLLEAVPGEALLPLIEPPLGQGEGG